ncbi:formylglycine-generating enzyme family protein [Paramicrobacterium fandaimingii]|uniref:formylglycine-generating enzyme family protein n=1 Tax=Paramicrobacterium fandaimingii TaxID=2708079 RepID=UPI001AB03E20|nr:SUMF1/EgtB/PvdO family nonheme iron enzyme [Microbacterium fandaimingii]
MTALQPTMIEVPGGEITMRDARSGASGVVALQSFGLAQFPVTREQFQAVAQSARGVDFTGEERSVPQHPVTWFETIEWCNVASDAAGLSRAYAIDARSVTWDVGSTGYRLPTEAEWEYACRAGTEGARFGDLTAVAWSSQDDVDEAQPVGRKLANDFGLYDMLGNVWEWCWNFADTARYADYRSLRGGGYADREWSVRASVSRGSAPDAVIDDVGFRVARGVVGSTGSDSAQGWSSEADRKRADVRGPLPIGWTPHRDLLR